MVLPNLLVSRKRGPFQFLKIAVSLVLILGVLGFAFPSIHLAHGAPVPQVSGPLIPTQPFIKDNETVTTHGNYLRLTVYTWGFDPLVEQDPQYDYFLIFMSATIQANRSPDPSGHIWCLGDGSARSAYAPSQTVALVSESPGTNILPEISPTTGDHGDETGSTTFDLSVGIGAGPVSVSGGMSWTQSIFQWNIKAQSSSSLVIWRATVPSGPSGCNQDSWIWGYSAAVRVNEGGSPVLRAELAEGVFSEDNPPVYEGLAVTVDNTFRLPYAVSFTTNPIVGSIVFDGTEFTHGQHSFYSPRTYSASAIAPEGYVLDHWESEGGVALASREPSNNNPIDVVLSGNGILIAVFAARVTFYTNPPDVGSISISGVGPYPGWQTHPDHPDGDSIYESVTLPPRYRSDANVTANVPGGYKFDHWSSTGSLYTDPTATSALVKITGPSSITAWFIPLNNGLPGVPSTPSNLMATGQYGHVDLNWDAPISDGGSGVTDYRVFRGISFTNLSVLTSVGNQLWYQDTSVTNGQVYYYRVAAINSAGESSPSNIDSARPGIDRLLVTPDQGSTSSSGQIHFSATPVAESGEPIREVSVSWSTSVPGATITQDGLFTAGTTTGTFSDGVVATADGTTVYVPVIVQERLVLRSVSFSESGLPAGTTWSVNVQGTLVASTGNTISFQLPNATTAYTYTVSPVTGYQANNYTGTFSVSGEPVKIAINWTRFGPGSPGPQGPKGDSGPQGAAGQPGPQGPSGTVIAYVAIAIGGLAAGTSGLAIMSLRRKRGQLQP